MALSSNVTSCTQRYCWTMIRWKRRKPVNQCTSLSPPFQNAGADSWVLLPPGDVRQQQRLPSGDEGGQDHGLWCGAACMGQEARRPCQDQQDGTFQALDIITQVGLKLLFFLLHFMCILDFEHYLFIIIKFIPLDSPSILYSHLMSCSVFIISTSIQKTVCSHVLLI